MKSVCQQATRIEVLEVDGQWDDLTVFYYTRSIKQLRPAYYKVSLLNDINTYLKYYAKWKWGQKYNKLMLSFSYYYTI